MKPFALKSLISSGGTHYRDVVPTLACEKLAELHGIKLSVESTRQMMIQAGYWRPKKGGADCTLLVFIDDATGRLTQLRFAPTETTLGYMHVLHDHILAHGLPVALYSDKHSIFRINAKEADPEAETQFSRAARNVFTLTARKPKGVWSALIRLYKTG
ncbi:hypothetical protein W01_02480 [Candidatus Nitrotoga sp. AM1P]|nr:hypothetical protein W01_02480 [Candidatus Nitrotoga sp. AM1P]